MQKSQKFLATASIAVVNILEKLSKLNLKNNTPENVKILTDTISSVKEDATDAFTMLSYMNSGMVQFRKDKICRALPKDFRSIRNIHEPDSEFIFGEDVMTKVNTAKKNYNTLTYTSERKGFSSNRGSNRNRWRGSKNSRRGGHRSHPYHYSEYQDYEYQYQDYEHQDGYYDNYRGKRKRQGKKKRGGKKGYGKSQYQDED